MEKQKSENFLYTNFATKDPKKERLPCTNDLGIEIDLEEITRELKNKVDIYVHVNWVTFALKQYWSEISYTVKKRDDEESIPSTHFL